MDLATLIGLIGGFAFVIMAMVLGGSIGMFVDVTSILIVVGGSAFVVLMKFTLGQFFGAAKIAG
ncbi:flagellar motor protein PomA, partial [Vibrio parahaemolyticus]|nr:flagellar motor protein PomA [Vibrio parahaemolyticus]